MKMITKEIEKLFDKYPLYSQDGKGDDAVVICKFFNPCGDQSWYVLEAGKRDDGDYELYTMFTKQGAYYEYGYNLLSEFLKLEVPYLGWKMKLERDLYFKGTVADAKKDARVTEQFCWD